MKNVSQAVWVCVNCLVEGEKRFNCALKLLLCVFVAFLSTNNAVKSNTSTHTNPGTPAVPTLIPFFYDSKGSILKHMKEAAVSFQVILEYKTS